MGRAHVALVLSFLLGCLAARQARARLFRPCGSPSCLCFPERSVVICSSMGARLQRVPVFQRREVADMAGVNLSQQNIVRVRPADFTRSKWPRLEWLDLRENANFDCSSLKNVPREVKVLSDCPATISSPPPPVPRPSPSREEPTPKQHQASAGRPQEMAQNDFSPALSSSSSSLSPSSFSPDKGSSSRKPTVSGKSKNQPKTNPVVVPFKGYLKLYLPAL